MKLSAMTRYTTRLLTSTADFASVAGAWNDLRLRQARPDLQLNPEWLTLEAGSKPGAQPAALALYDGRDLVGLAPFILRPFNWEARIAYRKVASFPVRLADLCGELPLCPDDPAAYEILFRDAARHGLPFDMMYLEALPVDSGLYRAIAGLGKDAAVRSYLPRPPQPHWLLKLEDSFEAYLKTFHAEKRGKLKRRIKKVEKDHPGKMRCETITRAGQIPGFLAQVEKLSAISWQGTRLQQVVKDSDDERRKLERHAERGWMRSYLLHVGDQCIAFVIGAQESGTFYYERIGYDPAWSAYSPGIVLLYKLLEDLHAKDRPAWLDFGTGDNTYKRMYGTHSFDCVDVYLLRRTAYMGAARAVHGGLTRAEQAARDVIERYGLRAKVLKILRRGGGANGAAPANGAAATAAAED
jgi:CelD/BcsL family acetyltransferase involved in cellulose biosynthesis